MEKIIILICSLLIIYFLYLLYKFKKNEVKRKSYLFMNKFVDLINHSMSPEMAIKMISEEENNIFSRKLKKILMDSKRHGLPSALRMNAKHTHIYDLKNILNIIAFSIDSKGTNTGKIVTKMSKHFELVNNFEKERLKNMLFVSFFILICGAFFIPVSIGMLFYFFGPTYPIDKITIYFVNFVAIVSAFLFGILREDKVSIIILAPLSFCISYYIIHLL